MTDDNIHYTLDTIQEAAAQLWQQVQGYRIIAFNGDMGAGKTTFIHALCEHMGVTDNVSSPTYALINEYHFPQKAGGTGIIYHMDWYRLKDAEEAVNAGVEDCLLQQNAICFVEWPDIAVQLLPHPYAWADINILSPTEREMSIKFI
ncbi:MAG: tRNA (adenosine(37)-N6)-threonylcarbamoyltransferase complex ATPase subunit type 1 TsaE [Flavipsychrobacter sp.]|nr:tRNA (adenosine(37)-N6)-threonylcarbamoyltransferase complex ATPase subunit type 1 TsaE [Flavipsychrobacter sp.]